MKYIMAAARLTGYRLEWLSTGEGPEVPPGYPDTGQETPDLVSEPMAEYLSGKSIRPVMVTVDPKGRELMTLVPVKAQAGYLRGYGDPQFIEKLPAFSLPILKEGTYRMFEVDGDSMRQMGGGGLHDGDIVIAQYLEDIMSMKDNRVYVVISTEGVCIKRCLNRLREKENPILVCKSDNKNGQYPDIILRPGQLLEVWELKAFISKQLSFATDLWEVINNMEVQMALMREQIQQFIAK